MRRLLRLGLVTGFVVWLLRRRGSEPAASVTVGYDDGSSLRLEPRSSELEHLLGLADGVLASR